MLREKINVPVELREAVVLYCAVAVRIDKPLISYCLSVINVRVDSAMGYLGTLFDYRGHSNVHLINCILTFETNRTSLNRSKIR